MHNKDRTLSYESFDKHFSPLAQIYQFRLDDAAVIAIYNDIRYSVKEQEWKQLCSQLRQNERVRPGEIISAVKDLVRDREQAASGQRRLAPAGIEGGGQGPLLAKVQLLRLSRYRERIDAGEKLPALYNKQVDDYWDPRKKCTDAYRKLMAPPPTEEELAAVSNPSFQIPLLGKRNGNKPGMGSLSDQLKGGWQ